MYRFISYLIYIVRYYACVAWNNSGEKCKGRGRIEELGESLVKEEKMGSKGVPERTFDEKISWNL